MFPSPPLLPLPPPLPPPAGFGVAVAVARQAACRHATTSVSCLNNQGISSDTK